MRVTVNFDAHSVTAVAEQLVSAKQDFTACARIYVVWGYKKVHSKEGYCGSSAQELALTRSQSS